MITKHVVMYSGGAGSAWVGNYVANKFGWENTILLHTDTKWEDEDNYRFMNDCARYIGVGITNIEEGRNPEEIFKEDLYFGNFGTAPCSKKLKMNQTFEYVQELLINGIKPILYFGIDYNEVRRAPRIAYNYKHNVDVFEDGIEVRFPLIGEIDGMPVNGDQLLFGTDYLTADKMPKMYNEMVYGCLEAQNFVKCEINSKQEISEKWGVKLPRMYALGFSHANCAGRCIKAGRGHYATLYKVWPERYAEQEQMEREINEAQLAKNGRRYTILSKIIETGELDDKGKPKKKKVPFSLEEYRKEVLEPMEMDRPYEQLTIFDEDNESPCECVF
jgi:hypothetical protein